MWGYPSFTMGAESLRAGPVGHDFSVVMGVLHALCVQHQVQERADLWHKPASSMLAWVDLCHCPSEVEMGECAR